MDVNDPRQLAIALARGRVAVGLALVALPGLVGRLWLGGDAGTPAARSLARALGARDLTLGLGALTTLREGDTAPEWVGTGAACDGFDALVCTLTPGLPRRARLVGLLAGAAGAMGVRAAQALADERRAEADAVAVAALAETVP